MKALVPSCAAAVLFLAAIPVPVVADGEGCASYRPPTAAERTWFEKFTLLRSAMPAAPAGWSLQGSSRERMAPGNSGVPDRVCDASPNYALGIDVHFQRDHSAADDAALSRVAQMKPEAAKQAQLDQLIARQAALAEQLGAAATRQDMVAVEKLGAQMEPLNEQIQRHTDEIYAPQTGAVEAMERDRSASVRISVNSAGASCHGRPQAVTIPGAVAWHCAHENNYYPGSTNVLDRASARMVIVFGNAGVKLDPWPRRTREGFEEADQSVTLSVPVDPRRPMTVQSVVVEIESDNPQRVAGLYQGMKLDGLRTLLR